MFKSTFALMTALVLFFAAIGVLANSDFYESTTTISKKDFHNQVYQFSYYKDSSQSDIFLLLN